jgi:galactokinase/mevalonate kinase-like predicted kinase
MTSEQRFPTGERKIRCTAPGRAGIIGNPSDMYGGAVICCSVPMRAWVEMTPAEELILESVNERVVIQGMDDLRPRGDRFDLARSVLRYFKLPDIWAHLAFGTEIPMQSGLAGSTALLVATTRAVLAWLGQQPHRYQVAETARFIELNYQEVVCGYQDAYMTTFGGLNYLDFRGKQFYRSLEAELFGTVEVLSEVAPALPFVLAYTGIRHHSGEVHKPLRERWLDGEPEVVNAYSRIAELAALGKRALLMANWGELAACMNENHAIQRSLGGSGEHNEILIQAALKAGAPAAKLAGAGGGGTIIALWPSPDRGPLEAALRAAGATELYNILPVPGVTLESGGDLTNRV